MRFIAIDHGSKHIGIAISDLLGIVARPLSTILHKSIKEDVEVITNITKNKGVGKIILGLPSDSKGSNLHALKRKRRFINTLKSATDLPLLFWDESDSTLRAQQITKANNTKINTVHSIAAAVILQDYLDTHAQEQKPT